MIPSENQREIKFKPSHRIKLNHNKYVVVCFTALISGFRGKRLGGIEVSTMQKGCHFMEMSFIRLSLNVKCCYCTHVEHCVTIILTGIQ